MTTLYIWYPSFRKELNVGHVSCQIGVDYISFWPSDDEGTNKKKKKKKTGWKSKSFAVSECYDEDCEMEQGSAHQIIHVNGLNEKAIIACWEEYEEHSFNMRSMNCATVVARCLFQGFKKREGGFWKKLKDNGRYYTSFAIWRQLFGENVFWTPAQVEKFAKQLKAIIDDYE